MTYTMPTEHATYLGNITEEEKTYISKPFEEQLEFWKTKVTTRTHQDRKRTGQFVEMINELRTLGMITAKERRDYDNKWKKYPDDRNYWFNFVKQLLMKAQE